MRSLRTLIAAVSGASLIGCASSGSTEPMATIQMEAPLECRIPCLLPPSTALPREQWEAAVFIWGADCAALHSDCVSAVGPK